jgi:hypothetical protein
VISCLSVKTIVNTLHSHCTHTHSFPSKHCSAHTYIHTTHASSPKGQQRHLRYFSETLPKLPSLEQYCRRDRWSANRYLIAVYLRYKCYLVAFYDIQRHSFILFRTPHETHCFTPFNKIQRNNVRVILVFDLLHIVSILVYSAEANRCFYGKLAYLKMIWYLKNSTLCVHYRSFFAYKLF